VHRNQIVGLKRERSYAWKQKFGDWFENSRWLRVSHVGRWPGTRKESYIN
jgi:hypothetical protein